MTATDNPTGPIAETGLGGEFPEARRDEWVRRAAKALVRNLGPDADPEQVISRLRSTTYDGIVVEPLYTADGATVDEIGLPGFSPFVRGRTAAGTRADGWDIRQHVDATSTEFTAVPELAAGATSLWLDVRGLDPLDATTLGGALDGVFLDLTSVTLAAGDRWPAAAEALLALWHDRGVAADAARGSFGSDPIGAYASSGGVTDVAADLAAVSDLGGRIATSHPHVHVVTVDGTRFHDAGASDGQELGFGIAAAVGTLRAFEAAGRDLATSFRQIELRFAATADQFATIAKFRAARRLWARVAEVAGVADAAGDTPIHAVTSSAMLTRYDPWVNLLRGTIACFGAGVGGADAITVLPYDAVVDPGGSELGRRIARNTPSILSKEANLSRVVDPGGGSWYIERLTDQLAEAAWAVFRGTEALGGLVAAVDSGAVAEQIDASWTARRRNIVTRHDPLTGVSEFPNLLEPVPPADAVGVAAAGTDRPSSPNALARHRYAEPFETLRQRVDRFASERGGRPSVFLANLGPPAVHTARATFATNLFEIAGLSTISGPGSTDPAELAAQFASSGAQVVCICSSDAVYADIGVEAAAALRARNPAVLYLAGRPRDIVDRLADAGVDGFIAAGADAEQTLSDLLQRLDVP